MTRPAQDIIPALEAVYVAMRDGVRLAVDVWRRADQAGDPRPTMLLTTRYWRSFALAEDNPRLQGVFALASYFTRQGYVVVNADSRGSGASFGVRRSEWSEEEVAEAGRRLTLALNRLENEAERHYGYPGDLPETAAEPVEVHS